jgi:hypothetical protein
LKNIAICFFGNSGGKEGSYGQGGYLDPTFSLNDFKKKIKDENYRYYYFIHSWSFEYEKELDNIFSFSEKIFEPNSNLKFKEIDKMGLNHFNTYKNFFSEKQWNLFENLSFGAQSRWYSNYKSVELMKDFSIKKNINFDLVFQTRMDLVLKKNINFSLIDKNYIYSNGRDKKKDIIGEMFLISNYENAIKFASIFNRLENYSLRPPVAAKQHIDYLNLKHLSLLTQQDYELTRNFLKKNKNFWFKIKKFIKKILNKN